LAKPDNKPDRRSLAFLLADTARGFADDFQVNCRLAGEVRERLEAHMSLVVVVRTIWSITPERLFTTADPDYERMARAALVAHQGDQAGASPDLVRNLSVVFRRLRRSQGPDERFTSLDLERTDHRRLFEEQGARCAVCRYLFKDHDLEPEQEGLASVACEAALPGEERLERYYRTPELDHILPKFLGGDTAANWQILCKSCNAGKGEGIAWVLRRGLMPAARPSEAMKLSPALRYAVLCSHHASDTTDEAAIAEGELRILRKRQDILPVFDNLRIGAARDGC
jgi:hypothetical protein